MWDEGTPGLGLRVTPNGKPSYVFQGSYCGRDIRITIGSPAAWSIKEAQAKAREFQRQIDEGKDPRGLKREALAAQKADDAQRAAQGVTVGELWPTYLTEGKPKRRDAWKPRYVEDLKKMADPGGKPKKRGSGKTRPGPLWPLMSMRLVDITEDALKEWHDAEAKASRHQAARGLMMFRGFMRWCATRPRYRDLVDLDAGRAPALLQDLPGAKRRTDVLESAQMRGWWSAAEQLTNRTASVYLRALLLTGARREEMAGLRWKEVDFTWRKLTIADKVAKARTIPLTAHLAHLLAGLPRINEFVFASTGKKGRIVDVRASHQKVLQAAAIPHLTLHGLRRAYKQRGRAVVPHGAVDQIQGHAPSGTADGYAVLPLDDLRPFAEAIERHILELAGVSSAGSEPA